MQLFRAKRNFFAYPTKPFADTAHRFPVMEGQLFVVPDETKLPNPRQPHPGNLAPYYEEIVPNAFLVKSFTQVAKVKEL